MPFSLLEVIIIIIIIIITIIIKRKKNAKKKKKTKQTKKHQLTLGKLTNISLQLPSYTNNNTKHAPFAITGPLLHESRVVFNALLPLSPFPNSQQSFTHPSPIPGLFCQTNTPYIFIVRSIMPLNEIPFFYGFNGS